MNSQWKQLCIQILNIISAILESLLENVKSIIEISSSGSCAREKIIHSLESQMKVCLFCTLEFNILPEMVFNLFLNVQEEQ